MFVTAIKKAHDAVEGLAVEAAMGIVALFLGAIATLFAAGGVAMWLSTMMPAYQALLIVSGAITVIAIAAYYFGKSRFSASQEEQQAAQPSSPLASLTKSMGSMAAPMDLVASGLFARQFKKAPLATLAATAAIGALVGMAAQSDDD